MQSNTHRTVSSDPVLVRSVREDTVNFPSFSRNVTVDFILVAPYFFDIFSMKFVFLGARLDVLCLHDSFFGVSLCLQNPVI